MKIIYIATNKAMEGYTKIGVTANLEQRLKDLSSPTSVPLPFELFYAREVSEDNAESIIHCAFDQYRENKKREFFVIDPKDAKKLLEMFTGKEVKLSNEIKFDKTDEKIMKRIQNKTEELRKQFWTKLKDRALNKGKGDLFTREPSTSHCYNLNLGTGLARISLTRVKSAGRSYVGCEIYLTAPDHDLFHFLENIQEDIKEKLGKDVEFIDARSNQRIIQKRDLDYESAEEVEKAFVWLIDRAESFQKIFKPLIDQFQEVKKSK